MNQNYKAVRATAQMRLNQKQTAEAGSLSIDDIRQAVSSAVTFFGCDDVDIEALVADLEACFQTIIGTERSLNNKDEGHEPWLSKRKAEIDWRFWSRYEQYLLLEKGWPQATLDRLEKSTDHVLDLLTAPNVGGAWDRRGMVVGHVQSGKTANYVGLICKAADAGYKLIVVLAGFHKSLRSQTQIRLEEGFLGYKRSSDAGATSAPASRIGVGLIDPSPKADSITTRADDGDFKHQVAKNFAINPGGNPLLFVVKKNGSVLRNLLKWVEWAAGAKDEQGRSYVKGVPLLVIDDEADQGSIDTKNGAFTDDGSPDPEHDPTILNQRIRQLLHVFDQSAYVGYTATPFANIFIHEKAQTAREGEDLFPRSFIVSLPAPSNYVGPTEVFGYEDQEGNDVTGLPIIRLVKDHAASLSLGESSGWMPPRHKSPHIPRYEGRDELPPSLREAVRAFVLACAARLARGHTTSHNSMLIHVTRFTAVQRHVAAQVERELHYLKRSLRYGDGDTPFPLLSDLRQLWETDFQQTTVQMQKHGQISADIPIVWEDLEPFLSGAAMSISVREINGQAGEVLDYIAHENAGLNVIAVGGDKLSRGLTLEGLTVSYFLRASKMYDTLMQMGRWFGYRPSYADLCRLYTTPDLTEWYSHIAAANEELREDFDRMVASGGTPRDFGHRVKSHPLMLVTSQVKMRSSTPIDVTFAGDICETINFWRSKDKLESNWKAAQALVEGIERTRITPHTVVESKNDPASMGSRTWTGVHSDLIIDFLTAYEEHDASRKVKTKLLADYVRAEVQQGRLSNWTVLVASGESNTQMDLGSAKFTLLERAWHLTEADAESKKEELQLFQKENHYRIRRLVNPADETRDLSEHEWKKALELTQADWAVDPNKNGKVPDRPGGRQIRQVRPPERGLLIIYPLDPASIDKSGAGGKVEPGAMHIPVIGFAISFPAVDEEHASKVRYIVNNVYYSQEFGNPALEEEGPQ